jgi:hypothetical protein
LLLKILNVNFYSRIASLPLPARLGVFFLVLLLLWFPGAILIYLIVKNNPNLVTILTMGFLFLDFLILLKLWGQRVYHIPQIFKHYGLEWSRINGINLLKGLSIGLFFTLSLFLLEATLGWLEFKNASFGLERIILEGLLSALGIALAEELFFRGWLLDELQRDYSPQIVLGSNAIIFALLHFLKPIDQMIRTFPTFPALILLGLTLVWAKRSQRNRLGICIGLHGGLVWGYYILNVGQLFDYTQQVPSWITGIDGNPLAGIMGLFFLTILALFMRQESLKFNHDH